MTMITSSNSIRLYRMSALEKALKLELLGMRRNGSSAYSIIRREFGLKGNRKAVHTQFCELIEKEKARG